VPESWPPTSRPSSSASTLSTSDDLLAYVTARTEAEARKAAARKPGVRRRGPVRHDAWGNPASAVSAAVGAAPLAHNGKVAAGHARPVQSRLVSLGCPKNLVDSEVMMGQLVARGHELTPDPAEADVLVVNTCSFIDPAKKESLRPSSRWPNSRRADEPAS